MKKIKSLAGVRIIATSMITLYHMEFFQLNTGFMGHLHQLFSGFGSMGVAMFIMMSGFLNMYNYKPDKYINKSTWGEYIRRKIKKVYPLHLVTLAATMLFLLAARQMTINQCAVRLVPQLLMIHAFIPIESFYFSFNKLSWYLSIFLLISIVDMPLLKWFEKRAVSQYKIIVIGCFLFEAAWYAAFGGLNNAHWICYINPCFRMVDYCIGISLGGLYKKRDNPAVMDYKTGTLLEILTLVLLFAILPTKHLFVHQFYRLFYSVVAAVVIFVFSLEYGEVSVIFGKSLAFRMSNQTLNWYLMHQIAIHTVMIFFDNEWICFFVTIVVVLIGCYIWNLILKGFHKFVIA